MFAILPLVNAVKTADETNNIIQGSSIQFETAHRNPFMGADKSKNNTSLNHLKDNILIGPVLHFRWTDMDRYVQICTNMDRYVERYVEICRDM